MNALSKSLLLLARHFSVIKYWQTTPNKTRTVSHRALVKTQKASDSFVWAGFIASWFVTSPALTSQYTLDWFHMCFKTYHANRSPKHQKRSSLEREPELPITFGSYLFRERYATLYNREHCGLSMYTCAWRELVCMEYQNNILQLSKCAVFITANIIMPY